MFRCARLLYFGEDISWYQGQFTKTCGMFKEAAQRCFPIPEQEIVAGRPVKRCCQVASLEIVQWSWHMSRLGSVATFIRSLMFATSLQRRSASWSDGKESLALWRNADGPKIRYRVWRRKQKWIYSSLRSKTWFFGQFDGIADLQAQQHKWFLTCCGKRSILYASKNALIMKNGKTMKTLGWFPGRSVYFCCRGPLWFVVCILGIIIPTD